MNNILWMKNPIRINYATVYEALIEKPFSLFLMVAIAISVYTYISIDSAFYFELGVIAISLIISLVERKKINKLMIINSEDSLDQVGELVERSFSALALYSIFGWTYLILGLINTNFYLVLSSIMCIYFIGILTRRIDPFFD